MFAYKLKAKKNEHSKELNMKHVDIIIRYLARLLRTNDITLVLGGDQGVNMIGTVDTSYAPDGENYKSIAGMSVLCIAFPSRESPRSLIYWMTITVQYDPIDLSRSLMSHISTTAMSDNFLKL